MIAGRKIHYLLSSYAGGGRGGTVDIKRIIVACGLDFRLVYEHVHEHWVNSGYKP